jgi:hypothetical protein
MWKYRDNFTFVGKVGGISIISGTAAVICAAIIVAPYLGSQLIKNHATGWIC